MKETNPKRETRARASPPPPRCLPASASCLCTDRLAAPQPRLQPSRSIDDVGMNQCRRLRIFQIRIEFELSFFFLQFQNTLADSGIEKNTLVEHLLPFRLSAPLPEVEPEGAVSLGYATRCTTGLRPPTLCPGPLRAVRSASFSAFRSLRRRRPVLSQEAAADRQTDRPKLPSSARAGERKQARRRTQKPPGPEEKGPLAATWRGVRSPLRAWRLQIGWPGPDAGKSPRGVSPSRPLWARGGARGVW